MKPRLDCVAIASLRGRFLAFQDQVDIFETIDSVELIRDLRSVRHEDQGNVFGLTGLANDVDHLLLIASVNVCGRLVGQHDSRLVGQRSRDRDALLLTDGKLSRLMVRTMGESDAVEERFCTLRIAAAFREDHAEHDVFQRREGGQQVERLEDVPDAFGAKLITFRFAHQRRVPSVDEDMTRGGFEDPRDNVKHRRLAAAASSNDDALLSGSYVPLGDVEDREVRSVRFRVRFGKVFNIEHGNVEGVNREWVKAFSGSKGPSYYPDVYFASGLEAERKKTQVFHRRRIMLWRRARSVSAFFMA